MKHISGKIVHFNLYGMPLSFCNQSSEKWVYPYPYEGSDDDLCSSGCGLFSVVHAVECMQGFFCPPEVVAHFALKCGGRGDDGTDRPTLLRAMEKEGFAAKLGFSYNGEDLRNDKEALFEHLIEGNGTALCNLRVGHIVALIGARETEKGQEVLVIDSSSETDNIAIRNMITEVLPESRIRKEKKNADGMICSYAETYACYWAKMETVRDFNLLHIL